LPNKLDVVSRQLTRGDGVYIDGAVQDRRIMFTADTGAAKTVIITKAFKQIPRDIQPQLKKSSTLAGTDGQPLVELDKANNYEAPLSYHHQIYRQILLL
jgi:hypothetical protein